MTTDQLRKSILQQAIQGKLVPQDPNDEPASVLLERIREEKARLVKEKKIKKEKNPSIIFRGEDNSHYEKFILTGEVKCIDDEIPFDLPKGWEWCRLGEVITLLSGRDLEPCYYNSESKGIPYITGASNVKNGHLIVNRWTESPVTISKHGELILTCKGTIGALAFNDIGDVHIARQMMSISSPLDLVYLREFIDSHILRLEHRAKSIIPGISREDILSVLLALPPIAEQQRIVAKIEELMPLVEQYGKAQSELEALNSNIREQLKKSVLQYAIEGKLVPQCKEDGTAEDLLQEIHTEKQRLYTEGKLKKKDLAHSTIFRGEDNKYYEQIGKEVVCIDEEIPFEIPEFWRWVRVKNIGEIITGGTPAKDNPSFYGQRYPLYKPSDLEQGDNTRLATDMLSEEGFMRVRQLPINSILVSCIGSLGKVGLIKEVGSCNQQINAIIPFKATNPKFLYFVCTSNGFQADLQKRASSTTIQIVNKSRFSEILIPIPPILEQQRIVTSIIQIFQLIEG